MDAVVEAPPRVAGEGQGPAPRRSRRRRIGVAAGAIVLVAGALLWWLHARHYEDTDDAQVDGDLTAVSARVPGTVVAVPVEENQAVRAGDVLVELDPTDLDVAVAQARAAVAQAEAQVAADVPGVSIAEATNAANVAGADAEVDTARTDLDTARRELDQAAATARLARQDLRRARELAAGASIAQADVDQRVAAADVAEASVRAARQRLEGRRARLGAARSRAEEAHQNAPRTVVNRQALVQARRAALELAQAQLHQAELNRGYARVTAPADGILGRKAVHPGERIQPGQQLFALTRTGHLWVTANFRETQVRLMRIGQPAEIHVDALGADLRGAVESFAGATGSRYALLPPENASGNYVKVVQRIPVRIALSPGQPGLERLRPGMSVEPSVKVR